MKKSIVSFFGMMLFTFIFMAAGAAENPLLGTWIFTANQAPYEYSKGKLIFENDEDDNLKGKLRFDSGIDVPVSKITMESDTVILNINVEGGAYKTVLTLKENELNGFVETYEGNIPFAAKREVPES